MKKKSGMMFQRRFNRPADRQWRLKAPAWRAEIEMNRWQYWRKVQFILMMMVIDREGESLLHNQISHSGITVLVAPKEVVWMLNDSIRSVRLPLCTGHKCNCIGGYKVLKSLEVINIKQMWHIIEYIVFPQGLYLSVIFRDLYFKFSDFLLPYTSINYKLKQTKRE